MVDFYTDLDNSRQACKPKEARFALSLASGLDEKGAYLQVFGQKWARKDYIINKRVNKLMQGAAGRYYGLLMHPLNLQIIAPYALDRAERLQLLSMGAVLAYKSARNDPDVKALNPMVRCVNELNRMTGEHAAEQLEVKSTIMAACINTELSEAEATELYKQVVKGARITLDEPSDAPALDVQGYEPIVKTAQEKGAITEK